MNLPPVTGAASSLVLPKRLYPSPGQPLVMLLCGLALLGGGIWMALYGKGDMESYGWAGFLVLMGILLGFVSSLALIPGFMYLELTSQGLTIKNLKRSVTYAWRDIQEFGVFRMGRTTMVGISYVEGYKSTSAIAQRLRDYNRDKTGYDGGIGPYRYGMSHQELADLLNSLRKRFAGGLK